jgi:hypothetical protein
MPSRSQPELEEVSTMKKQHPGMSGEYQQHQLDGVASVRITRRGERDE